MTTMRSAIALPISKASRSVASEPSKSEMSGVPQTPGPAAFRKNESTAELQKARLLVEAAISKSVELDMARYAEPARNPYGQVSTTGSNRKRQIIVTETVPPLLNITDEIAEAAALVSEADARHLTSNLTARSVGAGSFWMGGIARKGIVPWGGDSSYEVNKWDDLALKLLRLTGMLDLSQCARLWCQGRWRNRKCCNLLVELVPPLLTSLSRTTRKPSNQL